MICPLPVPILSCASPAVVTPSWLYLSLLDLLVLRPFRRLMHPGHRFWDLLKCLAHSLLTLQERLSLTLSFSSPVRLPMIIRKVRDIFRHIAPR